MTNEQATIRGKPGAGQEGERAPSSLMTFLIADVRGYTRFAAEHGDEAAAKLAIKFAELTETVVGAHEGTLVELRGDEALVVFSSARNALRASIDLRQQFAHSLAEDPSLPLHVGIGMDAGEAVPVKGGYRGGALNLAARLCSIAGPGETFASESVTHLARKTDGILFLDRGEITLKGMPAPVRVFQIAAEEEMLGDLPPLQPAMDVHPTNLPDEPTPFIGREREISDIAHYLRQLHGRLLTITGPGGAGKTRLALQVGGSVLYEFRHGVFLVPLAGLTDAALVPAALASPLGIREQGERPLVEVLHTYLHDKHVLLILDNMEHLLDATSLVTSLLDSCRELRILVTTRIPLNVRREREFPVPPLAVPDPLRLPTLAVLSQYEAVRLFVERASAINPRFELTDENGPAIVQICAQLDGLPLAVELAAARTRVFSPTVLLERLAHSSEGGATQLGILTGGSRDLPARQQTLRATIDWSYRLLNSEEQQLFAQLSVFTGGWTLDAAERVCNLETDDGIDVLDGISSLVEKSLVRMQEGAGTSHQRFNMLKTLQGYAWDRLVESGMAHSVRARHVAYFRERAEDTHRSWFGQERIAELEWLEAELDNYRAALEWLLASDHAVEALELVWMLGGIWYARGHLLEGRHWLDKGLHFLGEEHAVIKARSLTLASDLVRFQGNYLEAAALAEQSLALLRPLGNPSEIAASLRVLGSALMYDQQYERARMCLEQSATFRRSAADWPALASTLANLGDTLVRAGLYDEASEALNESVRLWRQLGSPNAGYPIYKLGVVALERGELAEAHKLLVETASLAVGNREGEIMTLQFAAAVAAAEGRSEQCARLLGAADSLGETLGSQRLSTDTGRNERRYFTAARLHIGDDAWEENYLEGRRADFGHALADTLSNRTDG